MREQSEKKEMGRRRERAEEEEIRRINSSRGVDERIVELMSGVISCHFLLHGVEL